MNEKMLRAVHGYALAVFHFEVPRAAGNSGLTLRRFLGG